MPKHHREQMLEHADQALNDYDRALGNLIWMRDTYQPHHPEYAQAMELLMTMTLQVQNFLKDFKIAHM